MKRRALVKGEPWQGRGTEYDKGKELTAPCGCQFRCEPWFWGSRSRTKKKGQIGFEKKKPTGYYWFRVKDCEEHKEMARKGIEESI